MDKSEKLVIVALISGLPELKAEVLLHITALHSPIPVTRTVTNYEFHTLHTINHVQKSHTFDNIVDKEEILEYEREQIKILLDRDDFELLISEI